MESRKWNFSLSDHYNQREVKTAAYTPVLKFFQRELYRMDMSWIYLFIILLCVFYTMMYYVRIDQTTN